MSSKSAFHYVMFKSGGSDGMNLFVRAEDVVGLLAGNRKEAKGTKHAGPYVILILATNIKEEVQGETMESVLAKLGRATGFDPIVTNAEGEVPKHLLHPKT